MLITVVMSGAGGMTAGLALGAVLACATFVIQSSRRGSPLRRVVSMAGLRSRRPRSSAARALLDRHARRCVVVQLQGNLFFGNVVGIAADLTRLLKSISERAKDDALGALGALGGGGGGGGAPCEVLILDFTLVVGVDSSAAESIEKWFAVAQAHGAALVFARGGVDGFPCATPLSARLAEVSAAARTKKVSPKPSPNSSPSEARALSKSELAVTLAVVDELEDACAWAEDRLIAAHASRDDARVARQSRDAAVAMLGDRDPCTHPLYRLPAIGPGDFGAIDRLLAGFEPLRPRCEEGDVLWAQGDAPDRCVLVVEVWRARSSVRARASVVRAATCFDVLACQDLIATRWLRRGRETRVLLCLAGGYVLADARRSALWRARISPPPADSD